MVIKTEILHKISADFMNMINALTDCPSFCREHSFLLPLQYVEYGLGVSQYCIYVVTALIYIQRYDLNHLFTHL